MEDWLHFPQPVPEIIPHAREEDALDVRSWLWFVAALVFCMVILGGATRLTESGLSIVEWKPVTGVIPPLNDKEWSEAFDAYKQIPQFKDMFPNMDLAGFQWIYGWEWAHRLLGRLIGVAFALPLLWFWSRGRLTPGLKVKLLGILALGALQGGVGWWMVASGLDKRVEVAQERLAVHLIIAAAIFASCLWVAGGLGPRVRAVMHEGLGRLRIESRVLLGFVFLQIFMGGIVAGLRAGYVANTWPLMDGYLIPPANMLWSLEPLWRNLFEDPMTAQFFHRMIAYVIFALALIHVIDAVVTTDGSVERGSGVVFAHVVLQIVLGVATLLMVTPPYDGTPRLLMALAHQAVGMALLAVATLQARRLTQDVVAE